MSQVVGELVANELPSLVCNDQCRWAIVGDPDTAEGLQDGAGLLVLDDLHDLHVGSPTQAVQHPIVSDLRHVDLDQVHANHLVEVHGTLKFPRAVRRRLLLPFTKRALEMVLGPLQHLVLDTGMLQGSHKNL